MTYKQLDEPREVKSTGKVSLYRTENKEEYCNFLANFDEKNNEVLGISSFEYGSLTRVPVVYMVTYRQLK